LAGCIDRGLDLVTEVQATIRLQVADIAAVEAALRPATGSRPERRAEFEALRGRFQADRDSARQHFAAVMTSFQDGLFVAGEGPELPQDNLELERWFRRPKGHERRIHGRRHAGVRIVQEGPTLLLALDAHQAHPDPFGVDDLRPYRRAQAPRCQREAMHRRKVMRKARSKKKRGLLLADLERRYLTDSQPSGGSLKKNPGADAGPDGAVAGGGVGGAAVAVGSGH
jgi:hypothetical protein